MEPRHPLGGIRVDGGGQFLCLGIFEAMPDEAQPDKVAVILANMGGELSVVKAFQREQIVVFSLQSGADLRSGRGRT